MKSDRYEPQINKNLQDMGNYYGFVSIPCQPHSPTQKGLVENHVKLVYLMQMLERVNIMHELKGVVIRNDNGSQFIANQVRHHLRDMGVRQEFTHISTSQENAYIEAFHSIFEREVVQRFEFTGFYDAKQTIVRYMNYYNNRRRHGSLKGKTPMEKWQEYYASQPQNGQLALAKTNVICMDK